MIEIVLVSVDAMYMGKICGHHYRISIPVETSHANCEQFIRHQDVKKMIKERLHIGTSIQMISGSPLSFMIWGKSFLILVFSAPSRAKA